MSSLAARALLPAGSHSPRPFRFPTNETKALWSVLEAAVKITGTCLSVVSWAPANPHQDLLKTATRSTGQKSGVLNPESVAGQIQASYLSDASGIEAGTPKAGKMMT